MRRKQPALPPVPDGVPIEVLLGPCVDVHVPSPSPITAEMRSLRFRRARRRWEQERARYLRRPGARLSDLSGVTAQPWVIAEQTPHGLAQRLAAAGLPSDWRPE